MNTKLYVLVDPTDDNIHVMTLSHSLEETRRRAADVGCEHTGYINEWTLDAKTLAFDPEQRAIYLDLMGTAGHLVPPQAVVNLTKSLTKC